ncbi:hypothetical protein LO762_07045 [Actinocorallia sp. API 0066]|uniref:hypothetical protein n=1 Tax=Actinocorallia sp. API 0066 TaxID=2896846 RepID=UPI001E430BFA|nr:hypothetical protein [Actinocorallia sp. API 0066]MCD0448945.1 hypothetical protein [Actinocorallia sp. API 0066]
MFIQLIEAPAADADTLREASYRWADKLGSTSVGWLGCTSGVTEDGVWISAERFESEQKAWVESGRPGRRRWWAETLRGLAGEARFINCREVEVFAPDPSAIDTARYIEIVQGRVKDAALMRTLLRSMEKQMYAHRTDLLGSTLAFHPDDGYTHILYHTDEDAVFDAQLRETPPQVKAMMDAIYELNTVAPRHLLLTDPWVHSRRQTTR